MVPAAQIQRPVLAQDTAGRWLEVTPENEILIQRWLNLAHQTNPCTLREDVSSFKRTRGHRPGKYGVTYYRWTDNYELGLRIAYLGMPNAYQVTTVALLGDIKTQDALDLFVDQLSAYLRSVGADHAFGMPAKRVAHPQMAELFRLVPRHPRLRVVNQVESELASRWKICLV